MTEGLRWSRSVGCEIDPIGCFGTSNNMTNVAWLRKKMKYRQKMATIQHHLYTNTEMTKKNDGTWNWILFGNCHSPGNMKKGRSLLLTSDLLLLTHPSSGLVINVFTLPIRIKE